MEKPMTALYPQCKDCKNAPVFRTRQKAIGKRPTLRWLSACAAHAPSGQPVPVPPFFRQFLPEGTTHHAFWETEPLKVEA